MPRPSKGPRLYLKSRAGRPPFYVIRDRGVEVSTGCGADDSEGAERALKAYLSNKHETTVGAHDPRAIRVADVLSYYVGQKEPSEGADARAFKSYEDLSRGVERLLEWWPEKHPYLADVKASSCKDYVRHRTSQTNRRAKEGNGKPISVGTAQRELETLRAAINDYHAEYILDAVPVVTMPEERGARRRNRWLTRSEAAEALLASMGWRKGADGRMAHTPDSKSGSKHSGGVRKQVRTRRAHLRRFLITGLYTGTRHMAMVRARWVPSTLEPWIDVDRGLFYRRGDDERQTSKRQPPVRLHRRLLAHLRRWREIDMAHVDEDGNPAPITYVIHQNGRPLTGKIRTAWEGMRDDARLSADVVPHILRHTSVTWAMQGAMSLQDACDFYGMTEEVLREHYYHFHPDFQADIDDVFDRSKKRAKEVRARENERGPAPDMPQKPLVFPGTKGDSRARRR